MLNHHVHLILDRHIKFTMIRSMNQVITDSSTHRGENVSPHVRGIPNVLHESK